MASEAIEVSRFFLGEKIASVAIEVPDFLFARRKKIAFVAIFFLDEKMPRLMRPFFFLLKKPLRIVPKSLFSLQSLKSVMVSYTFCQNVYVSRPFPCHLKCFR